MSALRRSMELMGWSEEEIQRSIGTPPPLPTILTSPAQFTPIDLSGSTLPGHDEPETRAPLPAG